MDEPTMAEVLAEIKALRAATVSAFAEQRRDLQRQLGAFQNAVHLEMRAVDARVAVVESTGERILGDLREVHELCRELLELSHRHESLP